MWERDMRERQDSKQAAHRTINWGTTNTTHRMPMGLMCSVIQSMMPAL